MTDVARTPTALRDMETICSAYDLLVDKARAMVEKAEAFKERMNHVFG